MAADSFHKSADNRRNVTACTVIVEGAHPVLRSSRLGFHTYIIHSPPHSTLCGQKRAFIECGLSTQNALQRQPPHRVIQLTFLRLKVLRYTVKDNLSRHRTVSTSSFHKEFCQRKCSHHLKFEIIFIIIPEIWQPLLPKAEELIGVSFSVRGSFFLPSTVYCIHYTTKFAHGQEDSGNPDHTFFHSVCLSPSCADS